MAPDHDRYRPRVEFLELAVVLPLPQQRLKYLRVPFLRAGRRVRLAFVVAQVSLRDSRHEVRCNEFRVEHGVHVVGVFDPPTRLLQER